MEPAQVRRQGHDDRRAYVPIERKVIMAKALDVTGDRYGHLVALAPSGCLMAGRQLKTAWKFRCDCGVEVVRKLMNVRSGDTKSCGCQQRRAQHLAGVRIRLAEGESSFRALFDDYRRRAKRRGVVFDLDIDGFRSLTTAPCYYCNAKPRQRKMASSESFGAYQYNGLDRLDNTCGYVAGNVAPCCGTCNRAKGVMPVHEFLDWVRRVFNWRCYED